MAFAIVTSVGFSVIFYFILQFMNKRQKGERLEIKFVHTRAGIKIKGHDKKIMLRVVDYYYTSLFFIASMISFYINSTLLLVLVDTIIFMLGLYIGSRLLIKYAKRITIK